MRYITTSKPNDYDIPGDFKFRCSQNSKYL